MTLTKRRGTFKRNFNLRKADRKLNRKKKCIDKLRAGMLCHASPLYLILTKLKNMRFQSPN